MERNEAPEVHEVDVEIEVHGTEAEPEEVHGTDAEPEEVEVHGTDAEE